MTRRVVPTTHLNLCHSHVVYLTPNKCRSQRERVFISRDHAHKLIIISVIWAASTATFKLASSPLYCTLLSRSSVPSIFSCLCEECPFLTACWCVPPCATCMCNCFPCFSPFVSLAGNCCHGNTAVQRADLQQHKQRSFNNLKQLLLTRRVGQHRGQ